MGMAEPESGRGSVNNWEAPQRLLFLLSGREAGVYVVSRDTEMFEFDVLSGGGASRLLYIALAMAIDSYSYTVGTSLASVRAIGLGIYIYLKDM
jgi:hypothetical protein